LDFHAKYPRCTRRLQNGTMLTTLCLATFPTWGTPSGPKACEIVAEGLVIEVTAAPSDDAWGPTIEISVSRDGQVLTRLLAEESRPVETCWWADLRLDAGPNLVIGLGGTGDFKSGALLYEWSENQLVANALPPLTTAAGTVWRYVVVDRDLWAYSLKEAGGQSTNSNGARYRLDRSGWVADSNAIVPPSSEAPTINSN
jgi:hypothetical protein